jgi:membrane protein YdbS with pleckstrin-like domain
LNSDTVDEPPVAPEQPQQAGEAPHTPAAPAADAEVRLLDPRSVQLNRTINAIVGGIICGTHLLAVPVLLLVQGPRWAGLVFVAWFPLAAFFAWLTFRWPAIEYRHWRYRIASEALEIWSGVVWRQAVAVPRSRVQHIDVSQGPLERSYGLATLSVYTAGTQYSRVDLPGLDHAVALAARDALLPTDVEPAV